MTNDSDDQLRQHVHELAHGGFDWLVLTSSDAVASVLDATAPPVARPTDGSDDAKDAPPGTAGARPANVPSARQRIEMATAAAAEEEGTASDAGYGAPEARAPLDSGGTDTTVTGPDRATTIRLSPAVRVATLAQATPAALAAGLDVDLGPADGAAELADAFAALQPTFARRVLVPGSDAASRTLSTQLRDAGWDVT